MEQNLLVPQTGQLEQSSEQNLLVPQSGQMGQSSDQNSLVPQIGHMEQSSVVPQSGKMFNGRKRKRSNVEPGFPKSCDICNVRLNRKAEYEAHFGGKRHAKELRKKQIQEKLKKEVEASSGEQTEELIEIDPITSVRRCRICSTDFQSPMIEESHMNGRSHKRMVQRRGLATIERKRPRGRKNLGRCEICSVNYTSLTMMKEHLLGKKHKKMCGISDEPGGREIPTRSVEQPPVKKLKLRPVIIPVPQAPPAYELLERQAEEAYEHYKSVVYNISPEEAQALYKKYQSIYSAYEAAYKEYMASREDTK